ncbi:MAG TPA: hypothetical protein VGM32_14730 [Rhodopila sp.]
MTYEVENPTTLPSPGPTVDNSPTVNNTGTVGSGWFTQPPGYSYQEFGYNWSPGVGFSFPSHPGWTINDARVTNNPGLSFGDAQTTDGLGNATSAEFGFIDNNGTFTALPSGQSGSVLNGMNDSGLAVGDNRVGDGSFNNFIYNVATGTETPITFQGVTGPHVTDINDSGQMVGSAASGSNLEGLYLNGQGGVQILAAPGATSTVAVSLNNTGQIVGDYTDTANHTHGFLFDIATQAYTTLDFPNAISTAATGINDNGLVVGSYTDAQNVTHGMELMVAHT